MEKKYMVVGYGISKTSKNPYSRAYLIRGDKAGTFSYLDSKDQYYTEDIRPLGTLIIVTQTEV